MKPKFRRKKLIQRSLQLKLTATLVCISSLATLLQIFLFNQALLSIAQELPEADSVLLRELPRVLGTNIAWTLLVLVPLMFWAGIHLTHRIAGPAYRMEQYLLGLARGDDPGQPCRIRKNDELQTLCNALNGAVAELAKDRVSVAEPACAVEEPPSLAEALAQHAAEDALDQRSA